MTTPTPAASPTAATPPKTSGSFSKEIASTAYTTVLAVVIAMTDGGISWVEWITIAGTLLIQAIGIYAAKNRNFRYAKMVSSAITAAVGTLCTALFDGNFTSEELVAVIVAVGGALGITGAVSNAAYSDSSQDGSRPATRAA